MNTILLRFGSNMWKKNVFYQIQDCHLTESKICPQELFKTNLVGLDDVPLSSTGQKTVPVLAAAEILHINWILFFPEQSSTALFMQRAGKNCHAKETRTCGSSSYGPLHLKITGQNEDIPSYCCKKRKIRKMKVKWN